MVRLVQAMICALFYCDPLVQSSIAQVLFESLFTGCGRGRKFNPTQTPFEPGFIQRFAQREHVESEKLCLGHPAYSIAAVNGRGQPLLETLPIPGGRSEGHFTGTSTGAPLSLIKTTSNLAGLVLLAFRPTT